MLHRCIEVCALKPRHFRIKFHSIFCGISDFYKEIIVISYKRRLTNGFACPDWKKRCQTTRLAKIAAKHDVFVMFAIGLDPVF